MRRAQVTWVPSHLAMAVKMTVLAGMLRPMAKVSVANKHCRGTSMAGAAAKGIAEREL